MRIQDIADILIMTILVYQLYFWFRKTRALQVVLGLGSLALLYVVTKNLGLFMTSWILQELGTVVFILIIVVFQGEIRQALYRFSLMRNLFNRNEESVDLNFNEIVSTVFTLSERHTGALIVFERKEKLDDYLLHGIQLDSLLSGQLLTSIFEDGAPLHDGAVIVRNSRISEASSHLPLSTSSELPQYLGTRHRAAVGLTEKTDALVLVVSEERGEVSAAFSGELSVISSRGELLRLLETMLASSNQDLPKLTLKGRFLRNLLPKFVTFILVLVCWLLINARQGGVQSSTAQVKFHDLPEKYAIKGDFPAELEVQLKVLSTIFTSAKKLEVGADIDLSKVHEGINTIPVDSRALQLPLGVSLVKVTPSVLKITVEKSAQRDLPVHLKKVGKMPKGLKLKAVSLEPAKVRVVGAESVLAVIGQVYTEPLDVSRISKNQTFELKLLSPSPEVQLKTDDTVKVRVTVTR